MLQLRLLQQGLIALLVRILPPPPVMNQTKLATYRTQDRQIIPEETCTAPPPTPGQHSK
jgi:hypothetical protein